MRSYQRLVGSALFAVVAVLTSTGTARATFISTVPSWDGSSSVLPWGSDASGATPTYGQTFTATVTEAVLNSVLFEINNSSGVSIPYHAYVYAWNGSAITGSALFTSGALSVPAGSGFQAVTVNTGSVSLTPGKEYVAFFSTTNDLGASTARASWGGNLPDSTYAGGQFVYNNGTTFSQLSAGGRAWNEFSSFNFGDLAFTLTFESQAPSVPEPATMTSLATGVLTLAGYGWRKRRAAAVSA